jgi:quinol monooxygenase YgiN
VNRRDFLWEGLAALAATDAVASTGSPSAQEATGTLQAPPTQCPPVVVLAELVFPGEASAAAARALARLASATRAEAGCRRYNVGQDVAQPGRFHLWELWDDLAALDAHFDTAHMAAFRAVARRLGYSAPFIKRVAASDIADLRPAELRGSRSACP